MAQNANPPVDQREIQTFVNVLLHHRNQAESEHEINTTLTVFKIIWRESHTCFAF